MFIRPDVFGPETYTRPLACRSPGSICRICQGSNKKAFGKQTKKGMQMSLIRFDVRNIITKKIIFINYCNNYSVNKLTNKHNYYL